ncbi:hypothetical protein CAEBREN_09350 [Caenorhabditis brenneri]|uniref:Uncharacterized protein n=1 Tax=Caenorhabditis brenneri TaxID=135651 RepID=G0N7I8_CAEBE|nr:hypothetical protein CAEBREN_09350 [Caenorhabditis brenneri]
MLKKSSEEKGIQRGET